MICFTCFTIFALLLLVSVLISWDKPAPSWGVRMSLCKERPKEQDWGPGSALLFLRIQGVTEILLPCKAAEAENPISTPFPTSLAHRGQPGKKSSTEPAQLGLERRIPGVWGGRRGQEHLFPSHRHYRGSLSFPLPCLLKE